MRVVLDTNILISALMVQAGNPAAIYRAWQEGRFTLLTCAEHLDELRATLRKPAITGRIKPYKAGGLVNELKDLAEMIGSLPRVQRSPDPTDDFLLALCEAGKADYLVTGDRGGLLAFGRHKNTRIVTAREFAALFDPSAGQVVGKFNVMDYIAYLHKDRNSDFGVSFPDFRGCITAGRTLEEAHRMAAEALTLHIAGMVEDGETIPEPSTLDALAEDPAMKHAVAFLVPVEPEAERTVRINITARAKQVELIDQLAGKAGMTRSAYMVQSALNFSRQAKARHSAR
jgi:putative PIN family toxin of toxin-antitoxin system